VYPLSPVNNISLRNISVPSLIPAKTCITISFALLFLVLNITPVAAQTRARRSQGGPNETTKRPDDKRARATTEAGKSDNKKQVTPNPLVRKTALVYETQPGNRGANRPVLVNDIAVASRVTRETPASLPSVKTSGAASASNYMPNIWPVLGPLSSGFGTRGNPFGGPGREFHKGQDIAAPIGTPVIATADGTVTIAGWLRGYGWVVYIDHGNGISTRYGHLSRIDVEIGQTIRRGEQLGLVGSTGRSTGPHLHYEVLINGQATNPIPYLPSRTVTGGN
jgi:murein DD-endopeptidase MepM/ murein hydrolase activator NlpD